MNSHKNRAVIYCAIWPDDVRFISVNDQRANLSSYCESNNLEVVDIIIDHSMYVEGEIREGFGRLLHMITNRSIDHVIIQNVSRICRDSDQAFSLLSKSFDFKDVELHIVDWNIRSSDPAYKKQAGMMNDMLDLDVQDISRQLNSDTSRLRLTLKWRKIHEMLTDESYAGDLINALIDARKDIVLSRDELKAVYGGYDEMHLMNVLGFRIKGESTPNIGIVTDVLARYWDRIIPHLGYSFDF